MINQTEKGFELIILSESLLEKLLEDLSKYDEIHIVWQMKFKLENHIVYKDCIFSEPVDNYFLDAYKKAKVRLGKKISVKCSGKTYYSNSFMYKNRKVNKTNQIYKDSTLLERMVKICQLDIKSKEYEL